jgi:hypothetical protein
MHDEAAVPIIYIVSPGRSGSTLVGSVLGLAADHVYVGELRGVWREGLKENQACGCGQRFRECPFWSNVFARAFGGFDSPDTRELALKDQAWYPKAALGDDEAAQVARQLAVGPRNGHVQHQIGGNWIRGLKIFSDEQWRTELVPFPKALAGFLSAPFRMAYRNTVLYWTAIPVPARGRHRRGQQCGNYSLPRQSRPLLH